MALAIDASSPAVKIQSTGSTATVVSDSFTPPNNSLILVMWAGNTIDPNNPNVPTITDNLGSPLTYHPLDWMSHAYGPNPNGQAAVWYAQVGTGAAMTITVTSGAASPNRHAALEIQVITGADATAPIGAHGKNGSKSTTTIAETYRATATGSQGFLAVADWSVAGTETAGTGCTKIDSGNIGAPDMTYGFFRRTTADGTAGSNTTMNMNVGGTSTDLAWVFVEIVPSGAAATGPMFDNSGSTQMTASATSVVIDITNATDGAWCYAWVDLGVNAGTVGNANWTSLLNNTEGTSARYALLRRQKQAGDTTFTLSWTTSTKGIASWVSYTGLDGTTPDEGAALATNGASSRTAVPSPSATPGAADRWAVAFFGARTTTSGRKFMAWTKDAATFERIDVNNSASSTSPWCGVEIADTATAVTAASHSYTATHTNAESHDGSAIMFLIPAATGTSANAESPTATGSASDATAAVAVNAEAPSATGTAPNAAGGVGAQAGQPTATGTANGASTANTASAEAPSATGAAQAPSTALSTNAETPGGTGVAADGTGSVGASPTTATGAGTAADTSSDHGVNVETASAAGTAPDGTSAIGANAETPSATGQAFDATVSTASSTNAPAETASGTGTASDPSIAITVGAETPTGAGAALDASSALTTNAGAPGAAGVAADGTGSVGASPTTASGTGTAGDTSSDHTANAETPSAAGQAFDATVATSGSANAPAEQPVATGQALDASTDHTANAGQPTATGQAFDATVSTAATTNAPAETANGAGAAADATVSIATLAGTATASGSAAGPTAALEVGPTTASGAGTAFDATVQVYAVGVAVAVGQAFDATVLTVPADFVPPTPDLVVVSGPQRATVVSGPVRLTVRTGPQQAGPAVVGYAVTVISEPDAAFAVVGDG